MASTAVVRNQLLRRRSTRINLNTPIGISGEDRAKTSFSVSAKANKHGAAVQLNRDLLIGTTVLVRNKGGARISARIVAQISAEQGGLHTYGIEFVEEDSKKLSSFWGISLRRHSIPALARTSATIGENNGQRYSYSRCGGSFSRCRARNSDFEVETKSSTLVDCHPTPQSQTGSLFRDAGGHGDLARAFFRILKIRTI